MKIQTTCPIIVIALTLTLTGCDKPSPRQNLPPQTTPSAVAFPDSLIAPQAPTSPLSVVDARKSIQPGTDIVITGFVGGRANPFVNERAIFSLADANALTRCDSKPGDGCKTPWDACCDEPDQIKAATATIQVVDAEGKVLKRSLQGFGGIEPGAYVAVKGTISRLSTSDALVVDAEQIHVASKP